MEERPKLPPDSFEEEEDNKNNGADQDPIKPGELFLKRHMEESAESHEPSKPDESTQERLSEFVHESVVSNMVDKESGDAPETDEAELNIPHETGTDTTGEQPKTETAGETGRRTRETTAEDRREKIESAGAESPELGEAQDQQPKTDEEATSDQSEVKHISSVLGEKAKEIRHVAAKTGQTKQWPSKTKSQSTTSDYTKPVAAGFIAAVILLLLIALFYIAS